MKKSQFQFSNPELIHINFDLKENINDKVADDFSSIITKTLIKMDENNQNAYVTLSVVSSKENNLPFFFDVEMGVNISWNEKCESSFVNSILKNNVPALLISYIRPIVSIITSSTGYPAFNIPFLDFRDSDREDK